ncbi:uncharacterized protein LOC119277885 isoform X2 [Triticum dicoccoides]|uniref:uncharacterized protein LOC119277885 isoform X2 n=1 Tax=Triticum dicoccoides TaxID=85692 RepID=UPI00188F5D41|nr:uncharacterized protein LOC119277885 isoform X2 [Triticum dicoccoides]XP_037415126.1 uncharacterized protein LOC119277885 isoform X2 [Triticum dicoccoides]
MDGAKVDIKGNSKRIFIFLATGCSNAWEWWVALSPLVSLLSADLLTKVCACSSELSLRHCLSCRSLIHFVLQILLLLLSVALSSAALLACWLLVLLSSLYNLQSYCSTALLVKLSVMWTLVPTLLLSW